MFGRAGGRGHAACLLALALALTTLSPGATPAQERPLSAIDWLSKSVREKKPLVPKKLPQGQNRGQNQGQNREQNRGTASDGVPQTPPGGVPALPDTAARRGAAPTDTTAVPSDTTAAPPETSAPPASDVAPTEPLIPDRISVSPLRPIRKDSVGLLPVSVTGLPRDFWGDSDVATLAGLITRQRPDALPEVLALLYRILLAELDAPRGDDSGHGETLLLARIDKLLELGALDQAQALLERAGPDDVALFRRWFDVSLLTGHVDHACAAMRTTPGFAPTLQARIFCLAREGDWNAATLTLSTGQALGFLDKQQTELLARFLDPELYDGAPDLPPPERMTPLVFTMREALAQPRPAGTLPLAFEQVDLSPNAGWRARIKAAERLVRTRAISPNQLIGLYNEGKPPASGGVWERVRTVQAFDVALLSGNDSAIAETLPRAWKQMRAAGLEEPFARYYADRLLGRSLHGEAAEIVFRLGLLSHDFERIARAHAPHDPREAFLRGIALGRLNGITPPDTLGEAIKAAFDRNLPSSPPGPLADLLAQGRLGEAVLRAMLRLQGKSRADPGDITAALRTFRVVGLEVEARQVALQLMLLQPRQQAR